MVYALVGVAASAAVPTDVLAGSSGPLLEVVRAAGGVPEDLFAAIALVAIANGALLTSIMSSRLAYGMARDGVLPSVLTRVLPGRRTPWVAVLVTTGASALLALTGDLATLAGTVVLLLLVVFVAANSAVLVLRRDRVAHDHFRTPTVLPYLGLASCVLLATQLDGDVLLRGVLALAVGLLLGLPAALRARGRAFGEGSSVTPYPEDEPAPGRAASPL